MTASAKKKWNSSSKLENKTVSHTANGQMKHNSVRKVLNFQQPKPKAPKVSAMFYLKFILTHYFLGYFSSNLGLLNIILSGLLYVTVIC